VVYKIDPDECLSCGACEAECENKAISEGASSYQINPEKCTECVGIAPAPKCVDACPNAAISQDTSRTESHDELLKKWQKLHPGQTPKV